MGKKLNLSPEDKIIHVRLLANIRQKRFYQKHKDVLREKREMKKIQKLETTDQTCEV